MNINYFGITMIAFAGSVFLFLLATLMNRGGKKLNQPVRWLGFIFYSMTAGSFCAGIMHRATLDQVLTTNTFFIATVVTAIVLGNKLIVSERGNVVWGVVDGIFGGKAKSGGVKFTLLYPGLGILRPGESRERKEEFKTTTGSKNFELELESITYLTTIAYSYVPVEYEMFMSLGADSARSGVIDSTIAELAKPALNDLLASMQADGVDGAKELIRKKKKLLSEKLYNAVKDDVLKKCGINLTLLSVSDIGDTAERREAIGKRNAGVQVRELALENLAKVGITKPTEDQLERAMLMVSNFTGIGDVRRVQHEIIGNKGNTNVNLHLNDHSQGDKT